MINSRYLKGAALYGMARSALVLHNRKIHVYNHNTKQYEDRSLLFTERLSGIAYGTTFTAAVAPLAVLNDLHSIELYARGRYYQEKAPQHCFSAVGIIMESFF